MTSRGYEYAVCYKAFWFDYAPRKQNETLGRKHKLECFPIQCERNSSSFYYKRAVLWVNTVGI